MRSRPLLSTLYISLAAATAGTLGYALGEPPRQSCRLPDGSTVTLEGVTYGAGEHRFADGNRLRRTLALALPPDWTARLGCEPVRYVGAPAQYRDIPRMVCWFRRQGRSGGNPRSWSLWVSCPDGTEVHAEPDPLVLTPEGPGLVPRPVTQFPRREGLVRLHVYAENGTMENRSVLAGIFRIPNPTPGPHPRWEAEPLPAFRSFAGVEVRLMEVSQLRRSGPYPGHPAWTGTSVRLRVSERGSPTPEWRPVEVVISDPTGNQVHPGWQSSDLEELPNGEWQTLAWQSLPAEPVWKVTVRLARRRDFPGPARISIPPPPPGKMTLNRRVPVYGGFVVLERIHAPVEVRTQHEYLLDAHLEGFGERDATVFGYDRDNPFNPGLFLASSGPMTWDVGRVGQTRPIELTFERKYTILPTSRSRTVEFLARPAHR